MTLKGLPPEIVRIANDIRDMRIRGAGRIARAAAEALKIAAENYRGPERASEFVDYMNKVGEYLKSTRPTAVSLPNAVGYVLTRVNQALVKGLSLEEMKRIAIESAVNFIEISIRAVKLIGEIGAKIISDGETILTHCNSSAAISILSHAKMQGKDLEVYATETRPKFQGYITFKALRNLSIKAKIIPDSAVRYIMKEVDRVIVGADAVAANGAVVNKIGTSLIALAAHEARVRVFVAAESYKFSPATVLGELVVIEERSPLEVVPEDFVKSYPNVTIRNPAFDVTPPEYIDAIITEKGLIPPKAAILVLTEEYGRVIEEELTRISPEEL
ncbi:MAG: ribose 1,5-bisphosphate isomerase [Thermoprotei archaeon]|nr:MAG: ribose 1,5-bisphosphate isomerase [Thermoprotei archaeon]RLF03441.1 MAG: ribose 1,5-bisphosphate isomerase [Thermoprotei archaeon]